MVQVPKLLSKGGQFFMVTVPENDPAGEKLTYLCNMIGPHMLLYGCSMLWGHFVAFYGAIFDGFLLYFSWFLFLLVLPSVCMWLDIPCACLPYAWCNPDPVLMNTVHGVAAGLSLKCAHLPKATSQPCDTAMKHSRAACIIMYTACLGVSVDMLYVLLCRDFEAVGCGWASWYALSTTMPYCCIHRSTACLFPGCFVVVQLLLDFKVLWNILAMGMASCPTWPIRIKCSMHC